MDCLNFSTNSIQQMLKFLKQVDSEEDNR